MRKLVGEGFICGNAAEHVQIVSGATQLAGEVLADAVVAVAGEPLTFEMSMASVRMVMASTRRHLLSAA